MTNYIKQLSSDFADFTKNNLPPKSSSSMSVSTGKWLNLENSVKQSITDIILTNLGEVILFEKWGSKVLLYIDYPINEIATELKIELSNALKLETRIEVNNITIRKGDRIIAKGLSVNIEIEYTIISTSEVTRVII